jgi:hypothetical protein
MARARFKHCLTIGSQQCLWIAREIAQRIASKIGDGLKDRKLVAV